MRLQYALLATLLLGCPDKRTTPAPPQIPSLLLMIDSSWSQRPTFEARVDLLEDLVDALPAGTPVMVICFDHSFEVMHLYEPKETIDWPRIRTWGGNGGTSLLKSIGWLSANGTHHLFDNHRYQRLLMVTDGVATIGSSDPQLLSKAAANLASVGVRRVDVLTGGQEIDASTLHALTRALPQPGMVTDAGTVEALMRALATTPGPKPAPPPRPTLVPTDLSPPPESPPPKPPIVDHSQPGRTGPLAGLDGDDRSALVQTATTWIGREPESMLATLGAAELYGRLHMDRMAMQTIGSLVEANPRRTELKRLAGMWLDALDFRPASTLALELLTAAHERNPDSLTGRRLLAMELLKHSREVQALTLLEPAVEKARTDRNRIMGFPLAADVALICAVWERRDPRSRLEIRRWLGKLRTVGSPEPSVRATLHWETATDVDLVVTDKNGQRLSVLDATHGGSVESVEISGPVKRRAYPFKLGVQATQLGPDGWVAGVVQIIEHDGKGGVGYREHPFVINNENGYLDLGLIEPPKSKGWRSR